MSTANRKTKAQTTHELHVRFSAVKVESGRLQVPVAIERDAITLDEADRFLCGARLEGTLVICDDVPNTHRLPGMEIPETELKGVFDCKQFTCTTTHILATIAFEVGVMDLGLLRLFPGHKGILRVQHSEVIPDAVESKASA